MGMEREGRGENTQASRVAIKRTKRRRTFSVIFRFMVLFDYPLQSNVNIRTFEAGSSSALLASESRTKIELPSMNLIFNEKRKQIVFIFESTSQGESFTWRLTNKQSHNPSSLDGDVEKTPSWKHYLYCFSNRVCLENQISVSKKSC